MKESVLAVASAWVGIFHGHLREKESTWAGEGSSDDFGGIFMRIVLDMKGVE